MKYILIGTIFLLSLSTIHAQIVTTDNTITGIDRFKLRDSISKFAADIKLLPKPLSDSSKSYQYLPALNDSIKIGSVNFNIVMLDFDKSDRLVGVYFNKFFQPAIFLEQSRKEHESTVAYVSSVLNKKGDKKEYYPDIHKGYEWIRENAKIKVDIQETKDVSSTSIGIALTLDN